MPSKDNYYLTISSGGARVLVEINERSLAEKIGRDEFLKKYIPDPLVREGKVGRPDCRLVISAGPSFSVRLAYPTARCIQPKRPDVKGLIVLIGYLLERTRADKGVHSLHSSVIVKNKKAVVLFGGTTNLGKSSIAKAAGRFGWRFYSDEVALIHGGWVVGGARVATNNDRFKDFALETDSERYPIVAFAHPHLDNGLNNSVKWSKDKSFWHLKEELARKIRGGSKAINFLSYPLDSLDTFGIATARLRMARRLSGSVPFYEMRGTPAEIAERINGLKLQARNG